jgi:hypothetical protein
MRILRHAAPRLLAACALLFATGAKADYYVVVNEDSPVTKLSKAEVLHLFMGRSRAFPGGGLAVPYDLSDPEQRAGFYRSLSGMSPSQVTSYWARLMFSGRNLPPQQVDNEAKMVERVQKDPMAVGWLEHGPRQKGLRTVLVLEDGP